MREPRGERDGGRKTFLREACRNVERGIQAAQMAGGTIKREAAWPWPEQQLHTALDPQIYSLSLTPSRFLPSYRHASSPPALQLHTTAVDTPSTHRGACMAPLTSPDLDLTCPHVFRLCELELYIDVILLILLIDAYGC